MADSDQAVAEQPRDTSPWTGAAPAAAPAATAVAPAAPAAITPAPGGAPQPGAQAAAATALSHWAEPGGTTAAGAGGGAAKQTVAAAPQAGTAAKPATAAAATPAGFVTDADGKIFTGGDSPVQVGFRDAAGHSYMAIDAGGKQHGIPLAAAHLGTLKLAGTQHVLLRMEQVTLKADSHTPPAAAAPATGAPATAPAAPAMTHVVPTYSGKVSGLTDAGDAVLDHAGQAYTPVAVEKLPAAIRSQLNDSSRIDLADGNLWVYMNFALSDEKAATGRWVPPGHSKGEVSDSIKSVNAEAVKLPAESQVRQDVDGLIKIMGLVSTVEGSFNSKSGSDDSYASLGIFQWAMPKNKTGDTGSLGMFFSQLKDRAAAAEKRPEKERTDEDKLYIAAWGQCTAHKLDVKGSQILINGAPATGGEIESAMSAEMGKGSLRTYQLVAARDWVNQFRATVVRPGPSAGSWIGNGYSEENKEGTHVSLKLGTRQLHAQAASHSTVGEIFASEQSLAYAIMLGVNRPNYVEASLWKAICQQASPLSKCQELLGQLDAALTKAAGKTKRAQEVTPQDIVAAGEEAVGIYTQIQSLIWPTGAGLSEEALAKVPGDFKKNAMQLYQPSDARKYHRERRFTTVDAAF